LVFPRYKLLLTPLGKKPEIGGTKNPLESIRVPWGMVYSQYPSSPAIGSGMALLRVMDLLGIISLGHKPGKSIHPCSI
jgi:hypothetical protein